MSVQACFTLWHIVLQLIYDGKAFHGVKSLGVDVNDKSAWAP